MEAIILAAGLGTRLRPLTNNKPKALVEANGQTLLEINIQRLIALGIRRIVVNVHHFGDMVIEYISAHQWDAEILISDERDLLLDTGAGVRKASAMLSGNEPVLVHNVDIISHINLHDMIAQHLSNKADATLAVSHRDTRRQLLVTQDGRLCGWRNRENGNTLMAFEASGFQELAFSGIWIAEPRLLTRLPAPTLPYPIIPELLELAGSMTIAVYEHPPCQWMDVGTVEKLAVASQFLQNALA